MPKNAGNRRRLSRIFLFIFTCLLTIIFSLTWVNAEEEEPKPKPQDWEIKGIVAALADPYAGVRLEAANKLEKYQLDDPKKQIPNYQDVVNLLVKQLSPPDKEEKDEKSLSRRSAASALAQIQAKEFAANVAALLKDSNSDVRRAAADALGQMQAKDYAANVATLLKDSNSDVRYAATSALAQMQAKEFAANVAALLKDSNSYVRRDAADALGQMQAEDFAANVAALLKDSDTSVRSAATSALAQMQAKGIAANVAALLKDSNSDVRRDAGYALGQLQAKDYAANVAALLKDSDSDVRRAAGYALGQLQAEDYAANVAALLKDSDSDVRSAAANALGQLQAKDYAANVAALLKDSDSNVRYAAANALGQMQDAANVAALLKNSDSNVRSAAANALGQLQAKDYAANVAALLKDSDSDVRSAAANALGQMQAKDYAANVAALLKDSDTSVRYAAVDTLGQMQAKDYAANVAAFLKDSDSNVRIVAASALGQMQAKDYATNVAALLKDSDRIVRYAAASALGQMQARDYAANVATLLQDSDSDVLSNAASALGQMQARDYAANVAALLKDSDSNVRYNAAEALPKLAPQGLPAIVQVLNAVRYYPSDVNQLRFLAHFMGSGDQDVEILMQWIGKPKNTPNDLTADKGRKIMELFEQAWKLSDSLPELRVELAQQIAVVADLVTWQAQDIKLLEHHHRNLTNGDYRQADTVQRVIDNLEFWKWFFLARNIILIHFAIWLTLILAYPKFTQILAPLFWHPWARRILGFGYIGLLLTWVPWLRRRLLQPFQPLLLADAGLDNFVEQAYFGESFVKVPRGNTLPHKQGYSVHTNRILFLNPSFTPLNPPLERGETGKSSSLTFPKGETGKSSSLPFPRGGLGWGNSRTSNDSITFDAGKHRRRQSFSSLVLRLRGMQSKRNSPDNITPEIQPITQAIPTLQGQIVLEGESGLGKSMFLRHLANNSQRLFVYLPAQKCDKGVLEAIYAKLRGQVDDTKFLKNLIYNQALDICIDGLNEVTADTRAKVSQFAESFFGGNIIMTTQPLDWVPPSTAKKYELQPLQREQIERFLLSRGLGTGDWGLGIGENVGCVTPQANAPSETGVPSDASGTLGLSSITHPTQSKYAQACTTYLAEAFNEQQSPEDLAAAKRILSNPMDLTLVALMLSQGQQPNLFRLQEQQYQLMSAEYQREWHQVFPLRRFSQAVYQMRLNDETIIPAEEFQRELTSLEDEKYKMVISRQWENDKGEAEKIWYFRHDKIMEFFLVQNFLGEGEAVQERVNQHINDPRFRGVYLLLANLLPLDAAVELREHIIEYAANSKDHTLSDKFFQLVQLRLPSQWTQAETFKQFLQQHEQKTEYLDLVAKFLEQVDAQVKREKEYLIIESITSSLSSYAHFPVLITIDTPTDKNIIHLVELAQQLPTEQPQKAGLLIYKLPPDTTARMEIAKVRLRDAFLLIPIPLTSVEKALSDKYECIGLLEEYTDRYLQRADFFDDRNAITDTLSFFGRTELLQRLGEELLRYQGVGLFGLRKSGKTSVLLQLGFMLREHPIVHIDLQTYSGSRYGANLFNKFIHCLSTLESADSLPQFPPFTTDKPASELASEFIQRVNQLASAIQKNNQYKLPILCFLDEVERIIPTPADSREKAEEFNAVFGALRVLCQQQRQISLLIADVHPDCNRINYWSQSGVATNPVYSFFKEIFLAPFSADETQDMLVNLGKLMGLEFDADTPQQIHNQSGGHPFVSRQLARFLTEKIKDNNTKLNQNGNLLITWAMVAPYLARTLTQKGELKNYLEKSIWEDLEKRDFQVAISILRVIACNEQFYDKIPQAVLLHHLNSSFTANQCLDACNWLTNVGLLYQEEIEHQDFYHLRIPLLSRWIQMQMTVEESEQCRILVENVPSITTASPLQIPPTSSDAAT
ncbi:HEAT repeat-containing PBS lyase [Tolypothrix tenuis PCC 7101]|uniref:HEAT repeat-containing PBS lyase n=2 Tax=Tolypothrix TaxID=111782 RepID=A0A1Z4N2Z2_9CYAN|nr:HEAT repeat-containing PBS lyase [Tolypothrix tenuis PCC 7101]BAZ76013.1 HEAT repeat-containing PBS lyase [Aulosira laxa NIES-50]